VEKNRGENDTLGKASKKGYSRGTLKGRADPKRNDNQKNKTTTEEEGKIYINL